MDREYDVFVDRDNPDVMWATWGDGWKMAAVPYYYNPLSKYNLVAIESNKGYLHIDIDFLRSSNCIPSDLRVRSFAGHYDYLRDLSKKMNDEKKRRNHYFWCCFEV